MTYNLLPQSDFMLGVHSSIEALKDVSSKSTQGRNCKDHPNS